MTELLNDFLTGSAAWGVLLTLAAFGLGVLINKVTGKAIFNPNHKFFSLCYSHSILFFDYYIYLFYISILYIIFTYALYIYVQNFIQFKKFINSITTKITDIIILV